LNKLLLLEDDPSLAKSLIKYLKFYEYDIDWAKNGDEAIELTYNNRYTLYLFDVNVPSISGIDLLKLLRDANDLTPTIIISAMVDIASITKGFIAGADDYLKKPFDPDELLIRIKSKTKMLQNTLSFGDYRVDLIDNRLYYRDEELYLGRVQQDILIALITNYPNPVVYDELILLLDKPSENALRVNIAKLKKILDIDIKNIRGVGYKII